MNEPEATRVDHELPPLSQGERPEQIALSDSLTISAAKFARGDGESDEEFRARIESGVSLGNSAHSFTEVSDVPQPEVGEPIKDQRTPEERAKDAQTAAEWIANPENRQKATLLAQQVQSVVGINWFSLKAFVKRTKETRESAFAKLSLLGQFGLLARKGDGPEQLFRVILSVRDRLAILRTFEAEHEGQLKQLRHEIRRCELQLAVEATPAELAATAAATTFEDAN